MLSEHFYPTLEEVAPSTQKLPSCSWEWDQGKAEQLRRASGGGILHAASQRQAGKPPLGLNSRKIIEFSKRK